MELVVVKMELVVKTKALTYIATVKVHYSSTGFVLNW